MLHVWRLNNKGAHRLGNSERQSLLQCCLIRHHMCSYCTSFPLTVSLSKPFHTLSMLAGPSIMYLSRCASVLNLSREFSCFSSIGLSFALLFCELSWLLPLATTAQSSLKSVITCHRLRWHLDMFGAADCQTNSPHRNIIIVTHNKP